MWCENLYPSVMRMMLWSPSGAGECGSYLGQHLEWSAPSYDPSPPWHPIDVGGERNAGVDVGALCTGGLSGGGVGPLVTDAELQNEPSMRDAVEGFKYVLPEAPTSTFPWRDKVGIDRPELPTMGLRNTELSLTSTPDESLACAWTDTRPKDGSIDVSDA